VEEAMREELSELIRFELDDPRVQGVEVSEVHCAPNMTRADVLIVVSSDPQVRAETLAALGRARHFLRSQLMERIELYRMPELRFVPGAELKSGVPLNKLLRRMRRGRPPGGAAE
jgi:ribosome-binding factor A